jgi:membrane-associated protein
MSWISDHLLLLHGWTAYTLIFLFPALEASIFLGFIFPGEIAVLIGGVLAFNHKITLGGALAAAILGAVVGDSVGYYVGDKWGDSLLRRLPKRLVKPEHIEQGKQLIKRLGGRAVFVGRFAAALRAIVPGLCGVSRLPYHTFLLWNVLGGACWATAFTLLGNAAGNAWKSVDHYASVASWGLLGLVVVLIIGLVLFNRHRQKRKDEATARELAERGEDGTAAATDSSAAESSEAN